MKHRHILLIEDNAALAETLMAALKAENYVVTHSADGKEALRLAESGEFDLLLLDLVLPSLSGFEVCQKLREVGNMTPLIFLTGEKRDEIDKVLGLELGGDDYIIKPFGTRELLARIKAVLRRSREDVPDLAEYSFGEISLDFRRQTAFKAGEELYLTVKEFGLLELLIRNEGGVVARDTILNEVWGYDKFPVTRTVDTFVHGLRKKIERDPARPVHLLTVHGVGYKFIKESLPAPSTQD
jgi:DNA-binding response OmpR family regulator